MERHGLEICASKMFIYILIIRCMLLDRLIFGPNFSVCNFEFQSMWDESNGETLW